MLRIEQIHLKKNEPISLLPEKISKVLGIPVPRTWKIIKESIDARNKSDIKFIYTVEFETSNEKKILKKVSHRRNIKLYKSEYRSYILPKSGYEKGTDNVMPEELRPIIVGFGPCGIFAALMMAEAGLKPIVIERGRSIKERVSDVEKFWNTGELNPESNVQFGEGGAGTFSDGKLTTGIRDLRINCVNKIFIEAGADPSIAYKNMPHIGTDVLRDVVTNIRNKIISLGGEVIFESKLTGIKVESGNISYITINNKRNIHTKNLVIAIGNGAGDTVKMLYDSGVYMEAKPFSVGVRIEHPQSFIDEAQYGLERNDSEGRLGAAAYKLSYKCKDGRGVYTFCMCPGGEVIGAASEKHTVVTNGMSYHARNGKNANSAILVSINPKDYMICGNNSPLDGFDFQKKLEKAAYKLGGGDYKAPVQKVGNFLNNKEISHNFELSVIPTYKPGVKWCRIEECLPDFVISALREALPELGKRIKGFDMDEGILTAVETKSSSPVRISRDRESFESLEVKGLYPAGEGAGYAGGIMSAAVDGIRIAEAIINKISKIGK